LRGVLFELGRSDGSAGQNLRTRAGDAHIGGGAAALLMYLCPSRADTGGGAAAFSMAHGKRAHQH